MSKWHPCCSTPCGCDNENCTNGYAPCCFTILFTGFADNGCGGSDCEKFNYVALPGSEQEFFVRQQVNDETIWECRNLEFCSYGSLKLTIAKVGDNYKLTVELDDHKWEKNYGEDKPTCCDLEAEDIPHVTNSGNCDTSGSTCRVYAAGGEDAPCPCSYQQCNLCLDSVAPNTFSVDFNGVGGVPCCGTLQNETFLTDLITGGTSTCAWIYTFPGGDALARDHENFVQFYCGGPGEFGSPDPSRYWWFTRYLRVWMERESFANNNVILYAMLTIQREARSFIFPPDCDDYPTELWVYSKTFQAGLGTVDCQTIDETLNFHRRVRGYRGVGFTFDIGGNDNCPPHPCDPTQSTVRVQAV